MLSSGRKSQGVCQQYVLERTGHPGGKALVFLAVPVAGHLGLSALATLCAWPTVLALRCPSDCLL